MQTHSLTCLEIFHLHYQGAMGFEPDHCFVSQYPFSTGLDLFGSFVVLNELVLHMYQTVICLKGAEQYSFEIEEVVLIV